MAKATRKTSAKAAKKKVAKTTKPVKAKKAAPKSKTTARKAAPKKAAPSKKATAPKKPVAKKVAAPKKSAPVAKKATPTAPKAEAPKAEIKKSEVAIKQATPKEVKGKKEVAPKKQVAPKKEVTQKAAPAKQETEAAKPVAPPPAQLNIFQMPNQRPIAHKPAKTVNEDNRTRYSDEELKEFEKLILGKLEKAREEYKILKDTLNRNNDEGTDATSGGNTKVLEDGAETAEKENLSQLAARQQKYITNLENALVRIKNGTYGICSVTGKLISKERLIAVPHTTQSIEAKMMQQE